MSKLTSDMCLYIYGFGNMDDTVSTCLAAETNNDEKQPQMWNSYFDAMIHPAVVTLHLLPHGSIRCMHPFSTTE